MNTLQAGNPAARRDQPWARPRRLGRHHAAHRPHRRLHRTRRRRRQVARRDASDLRRLAVVHDLHPQLPAADGDRAPARHADAGRARRDARPRRRTSDRSDRKRASSPRCSPSCPIALRTNRTSPSPTWSSPAASACKGRRICNWCARSPTCSAANGAVRGPACRRAGRRRSDRSARPARRSGRNSISPPAFPARSSTASASKAPTSSSRSTPTATRRSSTSPISPWRPTPSAFCRR